MLKAGRTMEGEEREIALAELFKKHPAEIKAIIFSIISYFVISDLLGWMWKSGTECGFWVGENYCQGSVWLTLSYVSIFSMLLAPGIWGGFSLWSKMFTHVDEKKRREFVSSAAFGMPTAVIWATIWLYCLPMTWMLLPWGPWDVNWWKIFPFLFGLIWFGGGPILGIILDIRLKLREFTQIEKQATEFEHNFTKKLKQPSTESNQTQFTSILGDMNIPEKYKK